VSEPRVIVALDYADPKAALALAERLDPARCNLKIGKESFTRGGPELVKALVRSGFRLFLDLKFHDIPNTVAGACAAAADLGVWMVNVHASGGQQMMEAARRAVGDGARRPWLIAVTVLTSLDDADLAAVGYAGDTTSTALKQARLTASAGLDGVVCSAREIAGMRAAEGDDFLLVTPGIRPAGAQASDQKRVMTPAEAMDFGASYLVIGRPITGAADPLAALAAIEAELAGGK
jgi:orotidine-5'-phosphate decarboxylase